MFAPMYPVIPTWKAALEDVISDSAPRVTQTYSGCHLRLSTKGCTEM